MINGKIFLPMILILVFVPIDFQLKNVFASTSTDVSNRASVDDNSGPADQIKIINQMNSQNPMCIAGLNNERSCNSLNDQSVSDGAEKESTETPDPKNDHYLRYENYELNLEANTGILHTADCDVGDTATGGGYEFEGRGYLTIHVVENRPSYGDPPPRWFTTFIASQDVSNLQAIVFVLCEDTNKT